MGGPLPLLLSGAALSLLLTGLPVAAQTGQGEQSHAKGSAAPPAMMVPAPDAGRGHADLPDCPPRPPMTMHEPGSGPEGGGGAAAHDLVAAAFAAINRRMHRDIAVGTGDPDDVFVTAMIAHHQGAIDMAKVVLAFGKDQETRKLAEEIVKAQEAEIATMRQWQARRPQ